MLINTTPMFYVPLVHIRCNQWDAKKKELTNLLDEDHCMKVGNQGYADNVNSDYGYQSQTNQEGMHNESISEILKDEISEFCSSLHLPQAKIAHSWFEKGTQSDFHAVHNHGALGYSVVCFVDYDSTVHEPTCFCSPFNNFLDGTCSEFQPQGIVEGDIIFFPSTILHHTKPSHSEIPRTVVSFNLDIS